MNIIQSKATFNLQHQRQRTVVPLMQTVTLSEAQWKIQGICLALIILAIELKESIRKKGFWKINQLKGKTQMDHQKLDLTKPMRFIANNFLSSRPIYRILFKNIIESKLLISPLHLFSWRVRIKGFIFMQGGLTIIDLDL